MDLLPYPLYVSTIAPIAKLRPPTYTYDPARPYCSACHSMGSIQHADDTFSPCSCVVPAPEPVTPRHHHPQICYGDNVCRSDCPNGCSVEDAL